MQPVAILYILIDLDLLLLLFLLALSDLTDSPLPPPFFQGVLLFVVNLLYARILSVMHGLMLQIFLC